MWDFSTPGDPNSMVWRDGGDGVGLYVNGVKMKQGEDIAEAKFHYKEPEPVRSAEAGKGFWHVTPFELVLAALLVALLRRGRRESPSPGDASPARRLAHAAGKKAATLALTRLMHAIIPRRLP